MGKGDEGEKYPAHDENQLNEELLQGGDFILILAKKRSEVNQ